MTPNLIYKLIFTKKKKKKKKIIKVTHAAICGYATVSINKMISLNWCSFKEYSTFSFSEASRIVENMEPLEL